MAKPEGAERKCARSRTVRELSENLERECWSASLLAGQRAQEYEP